MKQPYNRISEHVLFVLLLAALAAWLTAPVASDLLSAFAVSLPDPGSADGAGASALHREFTWRAGISEGDASAATSAPQPAATHTARFLPAFFAMYRQVSARASAVFEESPAASVVDGINRKNSSPP